MTFFGRIGQFLGIGRPAEQMLPLERDARAIERVESRRISFWRPWARRDAALASLQQGFATLAELMAAIRQNLEQQSRRQDEMVSHLARLPQILESLPETQRMHGETLKAMGQQLQQQITQQGRLADILEHVSEASNDQRQVLQSLSGNVQAMGEHNEAIADHLRQVGSAMESVGRTTQTSAQVLENLRVNLAQRDQQVEDLLRRQNRRVMVMLIVTMVLAGLAIVGAGVVGYLLVRGWGTR
jgi:chromosome segregation ATPase